jgi:hypothetical protein
MMNSVLLPAGDDSITVVSMGRNWNRVLDA